MSHPVRITCLQLAPRVGEVEANRGVAAEAIARAVAGGADLVVLPELASSGYVFADAREARELAEPVDGPTVRAWAEAAGRAVLVGGLCERGEGGRLHDSAVCLTGGAVAAVYRKVHLWGEEGRWFTAGEVPAPVVDTPAGRIGLGVCYDLAFPELTRRLALAGADVLAFPTASPRLPENDTDPSMDVLTARVTAYLNRVWVAIADRCGAERGVDWIGGSLVADPFGRLAAGPPGASGAASALCDLALARDKRWGPRNDLFADRRPGIDVVPGEPD